MSGGNKQIRFDQYADGRWRAIWRSRRGWWCTAPDYGQRPCGPYATREEAAAEIVRQSGSLDRRWGDHDCAEDET